MQYVECDAADGLSITTFPSMQWVDTYSSGGRGAYVNDAAHVRSHRVDGSVRAEAGWVNLQVG